MTVSADKKNLWIFMYDISSSRRREKIAALLADYGFRIQQSVFECFINHRQLELLLQQSERYITPQDSLIAFPLCAGCLKKYTVLGRPNWFNWDDDFLLIDF